MRTFPAGANPQAVAAADFNGDGKIDLAVVNAASNDVSILRGAGDGTFTSAGTIPTIAFDYYGTHRSAGVHPTSIVLGDLNSDGKVDLLVGSINSDIWSEWINDVTVLLGRGDGTFIRGASYRGGGLAVVVGDFNSDGKLDFVAVDGTAAAISIRLGNGDGTFGPVVTYAAGSRPDSVVAGDFDRDGRKDVAIANSGSDQVSIFLGHGDGTFATRVGYAAGLRARSVAIGDFNGDGKSDLAVANDGVEAASVLLGSGDGTFAAPVTFASDSNFSYPSAVRIGDVDGDGKSDLVAVSPWSDNIAVILGRGDGTFDPPASFKLSSMTSDFRGSFAIADLNGDGRGDLAVPTADGNAVAVLLTKADTVFHVAPRYTAPSPLVVTRADFDGDGNADLAVSGWGGIMILMGNATGSFRTAVQYPESEILPIAPIVAADINGDGKIDIVYSIARNINPATLVRIGNGDGTFGPPIATGVPSYVPFIAAADFNGDGKVDITTGSTVFLGLGDGTFLEFTHFDGVNAVQTADFNGDGNSDIVGVLGDQVGILLGHGNGSFGIRTAIPVLSRPAAVAIGDINHDGKLDVVTANTGSGDVSVLLGNGDGTFRAAVNYNCASGPGATPSSVAIGDFDKDGNSDLAVANSNSTNGHGISVLFGKGDGTFGSPISYDAGRGPTSLVTADFNHDGASDIAVANANSVAVLLSACLPSLSITAVTQAEGNNGTTMFRFPVTLSFASASTVMVNYTTVAGTATAPEDYVATSGTLTFSPGETVKMVAVPVAGDTLFEPDETFTVVLSGASNATMAAVATATATILNDDAPSPAAVPSMSGWLLLLLAASVALIGLHNTRR